MPNLKALHDKVDKLSQQLEAAKADYHYAFYLEQPHHVGDQVLNRHGQPATIMYFHVFDTGTDTDLRIGFWLRAIVSVNQKGTTSYRTTFEYGPLAEIQP